ncbi:acyloxyacyl hydrolase [uncultured Acetobacteroides sp.]|uniref:acyloxyacyl hydrolase n=1 Tax=uncultured Acetobacteroides sp. TaxID=1760811 RepID=UPI0029F55CF3|nr:acyloxyacyl hydrolase [uncultured Acetobacteroides sp.]
MKKRFLILLILIANGASASSIINLDSLGKTKLQNPFLSLNYQGGIVLPTNDFISKQKTNPSFTSYTLKYGYSSAGDCWEDYAYGMPYGGIGLYTANFYNDNHALGNPFALFAFQGTTLNDYSKPIKIKFEWQLGASFNWKPYDAFTNHENISLGSTSNVYVGLNLYASYQLLPRWDLDFGVGMTHFSNGASRLPNKGVNLFAPFFEFKYNFDSRLSLNGKSRFIPPVVEPRIDYDLLVNISSRQKKFDTTGTGLPSQYIDRNFGVYGLSFAPMLVRSYKYKYGASLDILYDESSGAKAWRATNPLDGKIYDRVTLGPFWHRFSAGLSAKGELVLPNYSIFANFGYNIIHGSSYDKRLYQVIGVKVFLKDNLFGTFGIRAARFSQAQYLYWSLGYTFKGSPLSKVRRSLPAMIKGI